MMEYKSKVDIIYDILLNDIIRGAYKPGERIIISKAARDNKMSEIPVREALRRLESKGYLEISANHGATVRNYDPEKTTQIFQIKGVLEGFASRLSIDYLCPADFKKLAKINEDFRQAYVKNDIDKCSSLNMKFHLSIYKIIPQKELYEMIANLWTKWEITQSLFKFMPEYVEEFYNEHKKIIQLLEEKQYDEVEKFMRQHKFLAAQRLTLKASAMALCPSE